MTFNLNL